MRAESLPHNFCKPAGYRLAIAGLRRLFESSKPRTCVTSDKQGRELEEALVPACELELANVAV